MDAVEPSLTPDDPLAKVIRYYRNHWQALFRFVDHPELPIDNSASEREYQNVASSVSTACSPAAPRAPTAQQPCSASQPPVALSASTPRRTSRGR